MATTDLLERSVELKQAVIEFVMQPRFDRPIARAIEQRFGRVLELEETKFLGFLDWFIMQYQLPGGRTPVEQYVDAHPKLPAADRELLLGWRDVVEGIFEVNERDGDALLIFNLLDELTYRVYSNAGPAIFSTMRRGSFINARIVPLGDDWMLSGTTELFSASSRQDVYRRVTELSSQFPHLVFRNPEKLAAAWELQREERANFIAFFGSDLVVLPGHELPERMRAYLHFRTYEARDAEGKTVADRVQEAFGTKPSVPEMAWPPEFLEAETLGVVYDELDGLNQYIDFGLIEETFANPALVRNHKHREVVQSYLKDPSISPRLLSRLAERDPERASQVFQVFLKKPRFSWAKDGEALLHRYKASYYRQPVLPSVMLVSEDFARAEVGATDSRPSRRRWHLPWEKPSDQE